MTRWQEMEKDKGGGFIQTKYHFYLFLLLLAFGIENPEKE